MRAGRVCAEGPEESAAILRRVLAGEAGAPYRVVLANAAAALVAAGKAANPKEGVQLATDAIRTGRAHEVLERLVKYSQG